MAAVTMAGSGFAALAQDDIKRVLAYSTIGQLGYMTGALAVGERGAAVFHLLSHGAFKALLFLAAGVIIHAAGTNSLAAMSRMKDLRARVPDAYWTMTVALLALAAIPPFAGFFSKESVLGRRARRDGAHRARPRCRRVDRPSNRPVHGTAHRLVRDPAVAARLPGPRCRDAGPRQAAPRHERRAVGARRSVAGPTRPLLPDWFDSRDLTPTLITSVLGTGLALVGGLVTYGAWRHTTALAGRSPWSGRGPPRGGRRSGRGQAIASHEPAYGEVAYAHDPADPGRLMLGPLHPPCRRRFPPGRRVRRALRPSGQGGGEPRPVPRP